MTLDEYNAFCAALPHASHVVQWGGALSVRCARHTLRFFFVPMRRCGYARALRWCRHPTG
jgi:predicted DNA-binding protein (MmcQ/YjbR family)